MIIERLYSALCRIAPMHVWGCQLELHIFLAKEESQGTRTLIVQALEARFKPHVSKVSDDFLVCSDHLFVTEVLHRFWCDCVKVICIES
jgi:hypothetical protein